MCPQRRESLVSLTSHSDGRPRQGPSTARGPCGWGLGLLHPRPAGGRPAPTWSRSTATSSICCRMASVRSLYILESFRSARHWSSNISFSSMHCGRRQLPPPPWAPHSGHCGSPEGPAGLYLQEGVRWGAGLRVELCGPPGRAPGARVRPPLHVPGRAGPPPGAGPCAGRRWCWPAPGGPAAPAASPPAAPGRRGCSCPASPPAGGQVTGRRGRAGRPTGHHHARPAGPTWAEASSSCTRACSSAFSCCSSHSSSWLGRCSMACRSFSVCLRSTLQSSSAFIRLCLSRSTCRATLSARGPSCGGGGDPGGGGGAPPAAGRGCA